MVASSAFLLAPESSAQPTAAPAPGTNALPAFDVKTVGEAAGGLGTFDRAYVTLGTNKAAFLVPKGYQLRVQPQQWTATLSEPDGRDYIIMRCYGPRPGPPPPAGQPPREPDAESCETILLQRHPNSKVTDKFSMKVADAPGQAFELALRNSLGEPQLARAVFIPALASVVEFEMVGLAKSFDQSRAVLNSVLVTFRLAKDGKLEIAPVSDKI